MDSSFTFTTAKTDLVAAAAAAAGSQYCSRRQPYDYLNCHIAFLMTSADAFKRRRRLQARLPDRLAQTYPALSVCSSNMVDTTFVAVSRVKSSYFGATASSLELSMTKVWP